MLPSHHSLWIFTRKKKGFVNGEVVRLSAGLLVDGRATDWRAKGRSLDLLGHFGTGAWFFSRFGEKRTTFTFEISI